MNREGCLDRLRRRVGCAKSAMSGITSKARNASFRARRRFEAALAASISDRPNRVPARVDEQAGPEMMRAIYRCPGACTHSLSWKGPREATAASLRLPTIGFAADRSGPLLHRRQTSRHRVEQTGRSACSRKAPIVTIPCRATRWRGPRISDVDAVSIVVRLPGARPFRTYRSPAALQATIAA